ncbi:MAG: transposase, partial [Chloroflexi bacterium]|nr:transposase [Chloroflexota bacterium]
ATAVMRWLSRRDRRWLERIGVVALDPHRGYANAVGVHLGHATLVVDHFHVIRVRHEAPCIRVGCKDPPPGCRSRPVKLGAA